MTAHLFVDESQRRPYLLVAGVVSPDQVTSTRVLLRGLRARGDRRVHLQSEGDARRRVILARLIRANLRCWVYAARGRPEEARAACLAHLVSDAVKAGVPRIVLESRGAVLDRSDRRVIAAACRPDHAELRYEHLRPHEEPLLWLADAVAWAYGAGSDWRRRVLPLVETATELGDR